MTKPILVSHDSILSTKKISFVPIVWSSHELGKKIMEKLGHNSYLARKMEVTLENDILISKDVEPIRLKSPEADTLIRFTIY